MYHFLTPEKRLVYYIFNVLNLFNGFLRFIFLFSLYPKTHKKTGEIFSNVTAVGGGYIDENGNDIALPTIYQPEYSVSGLSGAVFEIYADDDITTPDGTVRAKKGELVATLKTNSKGTATSKQLYLAKYRVVEKAAPNGFVLNSTVNHIELTYS